MAKYILRRNCEYSTVVEAESWEAALMMSNKKPLSYMDAHEWDTAWGDTEAALQRAAEGRSIENGSV